MLGVVGGERGEADGKPFCQLIPDHSECFKIGDPLRAQCPWARVVLVALNADPLPESIVARSAIASRHPRMTVLGVVGGECGEAGGKVFCQWIPEHPECLKVGDPLRAQCPRARLVGDTLCHDPTPESIAARSAIACWHPHITVLGVVGGERGQADGKSIVGVVDDRDRDLAAPGDKIDRSTAKLTGADHQSLKATSRS